MQETPQWFIPEDERRYELLIEKAAVILANAALLAANRDTDADPWDMVENSLAIILETIRPRRVRRIEP